MALFLTLLVIALVAYTLVKTAREKNGRQTSDPAAQPQQAPAPAAAAPSDPEVVSVVGTAFMKGLTNYFHSNWAKDGAIYGDLDNMPISCFTVQLREDRVMESITLEGQDVPLVNETNYDTLCPADEIPDLSTPDKQQVMLQALTDDLLRLGTLTYREDAFYPIRTADGPESKPEGSASNRSNFTKMKDDDYEALRSQMQSMLEQKAKQKQ